MFILEYIIFVYYLSMQRMDIVDIASEVDSRASKTANTVPLSVTVLGIYRFRKIKRLSCMPLKYESTVSPFPSQPIKYIFAERNVVHDSMFILETLGFINHGSIRRMDAIVFRKRK